MTGLADSPMRMRAKSRVPGTCPVEWIASEYLIAATAITGWSLRSGRNGHRADTADKARTARLQGEVKRREANQKRLLLQNTRGRSDLLPARCRSRAAEQSGFVRCVRAVSVSP